MDRDTDLSHAVELPDRRAEALLQSLPGASSEPVGGGDDGLVPQPQSRLGVRVDDTVGEDVDPDLTSFRPKRRPALASRGAFRMPKTGATRRDESLSYLCLYPLWPGNSRSADACSVVSDARRLRFPCGTGDFMPIGEREACASP